eukprot:scaffold10570_cov176-Amphora_coffeaeformis.AAC.21
MKPGGQTNNIKTDAVVGGCRRPSRCWALGWCGRFLWLRSSSFVVVAFFAAQGGRPDVQGADAHSLTFARALCGCGIRITARSGKPPAPHICTQRPLTKRITSGTLGDDAFPLVFAKRDINFTNSSITATNRPAHQSVKYINFLRSSGSLAYRIRTCSLSALSLSSSHQLSLSLPQLPWKDLVQTGRHSPITTLQQTKDINLTK